MNLQIIPRDEDIKLNTHEVASVMVPPDGDSIEVNAVNITSKMGGVT